MLRIRLTRTGKRHQPHYRLVVAEHTAPIKGKFIESLGHYNPRSKELVVKSESAIDWLNKGAQPSNTAAKLLLSSGLSHKLLVVHTFPERPGKKAQAAEGGETAPVAPTEAATTEETSTTESSETPKEESEEQPKEVPSESESATQ